MEQPPGFSRYITPGEFEAPDWLDHQLLLALSEFRLWLDSPMYFSVNPDGTARHPRGDAVPPSSGSHSEFSLHKYGIQHSTSKREGKLVRDIGRKGLAVDFDCPGVPLVHLYFEAERTNLFGGIGIYPGWHNPGLHVDCRPRHHPDYGARWMCVQGEYLPVRGRDIFSTGTLQRMLMR